MPLLVVLCATAAIYGISIVTAIETIAAVTSQICYHIMPSSALHQLSTFRFEFNGW
jgi:hypothetical protein